MKLRSVSVLAPSCVRRRRRRGHSDHVGHRRAADLSAADHGVGGHARISHRARSAAPLGRRDSREAPNRAPDLSPTALVIRSDRRRRRRSRSAPGASCSSIRTPARCSARETVRACARSSARWSSGIDMSRRRDASRPLGRAMTGASNLAFLFIVVSGLFLWWPRSWTWATIRNITWFKGGLRGKARDFNWHNTIGFWSAIPLAIIVAGGVVISYPWATALVYRAYGEAAAARLRAASGGAEAADRAPGGAPQIDGRVRIETMIATAAARKCPTGKRSASRCRRRRAARRADTRFGRWRPAAQARDAHARSSDRRACALGAVLEPVPRAQGPHVAALRAYRRGLRPRGTDVRGSRHGGGAVLVWTGLALALRRFSRGANGRPTPC